MGISHCLKLISTASKPLHPRIPVTAIPNTRGVCAQLECFSPSPSTHRQRDDQFSDAMGINTESVWATWSGCVVKFVPDLFIKLSMFLLATGAGRLRCPLGRCVSNHRFQKQVRPRSLNSTSPWLIPTTQPWKVQLYAFCTLNSS
jgi:hypothetical protein